MARRWNHQKKKWPDWDQLSRKLVRKGIKG
ncbi:hypothetical protein CCACVL1_11505 [Corchorus capsularis]|uniref:Uncharacterized protein n=1 Tax=Corchorus capsularis TaxID=210143 RepID=A0A1R3IKV7_COCAP|nr:hypothetical protein CCACVL1_11505 [Corchorus capsularis]